jgi:hypothetical protein
MQSNTSISAQIQEVVDQERRQAAEERRNLLAQITILINSQAELQESRLANNAASIQQGVQGNTTMLEGSMKQYAQGMDKWNAREGEFLDEATASREILKSKLKTDWTVSLILQTQTVELLLTLVLRLRTHTAHRFKKQLNPFTLKRCGSSMNKCGISMSRWPPSMISSLVPAHKMRTMTASIQIPSALFPARSRIRMQILGITLGRPALE